MVSIGLQRRDRAALGAGRETHSDLFYDRAGRVSEERELGTPNRSTLFGYDRNDNLRTTKYPVSERTVTYERKGRR